MAEFFGGHVRNKAATALALDQLFPRALEKRRFLARGVAGDQDIDGQCFFLFVDLLNRHGSS
jgi:hypothetical protein